MRSSIIFLAMLCFVNGRNLHDFNEDQDLGINGNMDLRNLRDSASNQMRHRRKARQSYYDFSPYYYESRRDYSRHQDEMLNQIVRLLDEISSYVRRPPPPPPQPQVVYVPYPVPYPVPNYRRCTTKSPDKTNITIRFPDVEDINMLWGQHVGDVTGDSDDGTDGSNPVQLEPIEPEPESVEPETDKAEKKPTTQEVNSRPKACQAAIILCCNNGTKIEQQNCFLRYGCPKTFLTRLSCTSRVIEQTIDELAKAYAPKN